MTKWSGKVDQKVADVLLNFYVHLSLISITNKKNVMERNKSTKLDLWQTQKTASLKEKREEKLHLEKKDKKCWRKKE